jgi:hypothetical protein
VSTRALLSLAALKVNLDARQQDYLGNFLPMVLECIRNATDEVISLGEVQKSLKAAFGLWLPQNIIDTLLRRAARERYIRQDRKAYFRDLEALAKLKFREVQEEVLREHKALVEGLRAFSSERFKIVWSSAESASALGSFLVESDVTADLRVQGVALSADDTEHVGGARFVVGTFIQHIVDSKSPELTYLDRLVKGMFLASALFLPTQGLLYRPFRNTKVYLDTPLILLFLGHAGQARQAPCIELLELLTENGAELRCFSHTLDEVHEVLDHCVRVLRNPHGFVPEDSKLPPSAEYFLLAGHSQSDIELHIAQLEDDLRALAIKIEDTPEDGIRYGVDEAEVDRVLEAGIGYHNPGARKRDVASISGIVRLRKGLTPQRIEDCRAVLLTSNERLALLGHRLFPAGIGPVITDRLLTALLWLKKPLAAPELPLKRILADCYAATQPDEELWKRYLAEVTKLKGQGRFTEDQYLALRTSAHARAALMESTRGEQQAFTAGTVEEIWERVEIEALRGADQETAATVEHVIGRLVQRLERYSRAWARGICAVLRAAVFAFLVVSCVQAATDTGDALPPWVHLVCFFVGLVGAFGTAWSPTAQDWVDRCENALYGFIHKRIIGPLFPLR